MHSPPHTDMRVIEWAVFFALIVGLTGPALLALLWLLFLVTSLFNPWMWGPELLKSILLVAPGVLLAGYVAKCVVLPSGKALMRNSSISTVRWPLLASLLLIGVAVFY